MPAAVSDAVPAVFLAHAWRLSATELVYPAATPLDSDMLRPGDPEARLAGLLRRELPRLAFEDARRWARMALREAPTKLEALRRVAECCVVHEAGHPAARNGELQDRLRQLVQSDALVCCHLASRGWAPSDPGARDRLDWSPTLPPERCLFDPVLGRAMAENHCHLGGAVTTAAFWVFALCGEGPPGGLFPGMAGTPAQDAWDRCIELARLAVVFLATGGRGPVDHLAIRRILGEALPQQLQATRERPELPWQMGSQERYSEAMRWPLGEWLIGARVSLSVLAGERFMVWSALHRLVMASEAERGQGETGHAF